MGSIDIRASRERSDMSPNVLRAEMLEPGDVLLTRDVGWQSAAIASLTGGEFSHAALVVNQAMLFESDGGVIGHKAIQWFGHGTISGARTTVARLPTEPKLLAAYRHPGLRNLPTGSFDAAFREEFEYSFGRDYSALYRLVPLANLPDELKPLIAAAFKFYEDRIPAQRIHGPFCSELVSRIYERMGLALFEQARPPANITPNHLANSNLLRVEGAVVSLSGVDAIEPLEYAEKFWPAIDDGPAKIVRRQRGLKEQFKLVDELSRRLKERLQAQLIDLQSKFREQTESVFQRVQVAQAKGKEGLTRWLMRICEDSVELALALAVLSKDFEAEQNNMVAISEQLNMLLLKLDECGASFFRCCAIYNSQEFKRAIAASNKPIERVGLRRARQEILKNAREHLHELSLTRDL
jgi:hypothetical protein